MKDLEGQLKESSFEIFVKPKMAVGVVLSQSTPPKILQLLPCSPMLGKLFVNDLIIAVDEKVRPSVISLCVEEFAWMRVLVKKRISNSKMN